MGKNQTSDFKCVACNFSLLELKKEYTHDHIELYKNNDGYEDFFRMGYETFKILTCSHCRSVNIVSLYHGVDTQVGENEYETIVRYIYPLKKEKLDIENLKEIFNFSPMFKEIYEQALTAEKVKLEQIAGMGFRKALEFLIKDYLILKKPQDEEEIKEKFLGKCINLIEDTKIKELSKRGAWLGNDEAHYHRKWIDKDISNLKEVIILVANYIEQDFIYKKYISEMTE